MHGRQRVAIGNGGWVRWRSDSFRGQLFLRFAPQPNGRLAAHEVYTEADAPLDARTFSRLPLGAITRQVNGPGLREHLLTRIELPGPNLSGTAATFATFTPGRSPRGLRTLKVPSVTPYPDGFYERVAAAFSERFTAAEIAEAAGVPITTVYRWVKEARRRGLLAPAKGGGSA